MLVQNSASDDDVLVGVEVDDDGHEDADGADGAVAVAACPLSLPSVLGSVDSLWLLLKPTSSAFSSALKSVSLVI